MQSLKHHTGEPLKHHTHTSNKIPYKNQVVGSPKLLKTPEALRQSGVRPVKGLTSILILGSMKPPPNPQTAFTIKPQPKEGQ